LLPSVFYLLELFVGTIQALVFGILTLVFMNMATHAHGDDDHAEEVAESHA
jgi:F-type H+-transporting ATPase subunit a